MKRGRGFGMQDLSDGIWDLMGVVVWLICKEIVGGSEGAGLAGLKVI